MNQIQSKKISFQNWYLCVSLVKTKILQKYLEPIPGNENQNGNQNETKTIQCHICDGKYNNASVVSLFVRIYSPVFSPFGVTITMTSTKTA